MLKYTIILFSCMFIISTNAANSRYKRVTPNSGMRLNNVDVTNIFLQNNFWQLNSKNITANHGKLGFKRKMGRNQNSIESQAIGLKAFGFDIRNVRINLKNDKPFTVIFDFFNNKYNKNGQHKYVRKNKKRP